MASGGNLALAFGAIVAGAITLDYGAKAARAAFASGGTTVAPGTAGSGTPKTVGKFPASVNPLPGASGGRLDQGIDGTGTTFLSPWDGVVAYVSAHDSGWAGGGYIAIRSIADPSQVYYVAEGIMPVVTLGQRVTAGQKIAFPVASPYNGIVGNFEAGLANPSAPQQPLAQVVSDAAAMVEGFAAWLKSLGGPTPTSTSLAGHA